MVDIRKALSEGTESAGGSFVPVEYAKRFLELVQAKSTAIPLCENVTMKYDQMKIPTVTAGNTAYWVSENATITSSDLTTGSITLNASKVAALTTISTELMEDSDPAIGQVVTNQLAEDVALKVDYEIYNGTGSPFNGFRDTSNNSDINTTDKSNADVAYDDIINIQSDIMEDNFDGGTHIVMHPKELGMIRKLKDAQSRPLFDEATFGSPLLSEHPKTIGTILGLKVVVTTQIPTNLGSGSSTDIIVLTQGVSGIYGIRRSARFNREYLIETDNWKIQTNLRAAFVMKYQKSCGIIQNVTTS